MIMLLQHFNIVSKINLLLCFASELLFHRLLCLNAGPPLVALFYEAGELLGGGGSCEMGLECYTLATPYLAQLSNSWLMSPGAT